MSDVSKTLRVANAIVEENLAKEPNGSTTFANTFLRDTLALIAELEAALRSTHLTINELNAVKTDLEAENRTLVIDLAYWKHSGAVTFDRAEQAEAALAEAIQANRDE